MNVMWKGVYVAKAEGICYLANAHLFSQAD